MRGKRGSGGHWYFNAVPVDSLTLSPHISSFHYGWLVLGVSQNMRGRRGSGGHWYFNAVPVDSLTLSPHVSSFHYGWLVLGVSQNMRRRRESGGHWYFNAVPVDSLTLSPHISSFHYGWLVLGVSQKMRGKRVYRSLVFQRCTCRQLKSFTPYFLFPLWYWDSAARLGQVSLFNLSVPPPLFSQLK